MDEATTQQRTRLEVLTVKSPCSVPWAEMTGTERVRSCAQCNKHVYDLTHHTAVEAEELLSRPGGACVRFYRREDGTVTTADCKVEEEKRTRRQRLGMFAMAGFAGLVALALPRGSREICLGRNGAHVHIDADSVLRTLPVLSTISAWVDPVTCTNEPAPQLPPLAKPRNLKRITTGFSNYTQ